MIEKTIKILEKGYFCDHCLGRFWSGLLSGYANDERGSFIRRFIAMLIDSKSIDYSKIDSSNFHSFKFRINKEFVPSSHGKCFLCNDIFEDLGKYASIAAKKMKNIEFDNFLVSSLLTSDFIDST